uniref:Efflux RND transporter periplasmic adaptor subunit n=1 Tax=candidate division CPR3 bacterium TaxID=2268181 RepID=A0A7C4M0A8_UNCC3
MNFKFSEIKNFIKKNKKKTIVYSIILMLVIWIGSSVIASKNKKPDFEYYTVTTGTVEQEITATGKVKPAEGLDYAFEMGGKVATVNVKVGDKVKSGQTLATLKNNDLSSSVAQASAGVESAKSNIAQYEAAVASQKARLDEVKKGARPEEITMSELKVENAKKLLEDAKKNLENTKTKAEQDYSQILLDGANSSSSAVNIGLNTLHTITDIQYAHFNGNDQEASVLAAAKANAVNALVGGQDAGRWIFQFINDMHGGARGSAENAQKNINETNVLKALNETNSALIKINQTLDIIPFNTSILTATEKSNIALERSNMNNQLTLISNKIKAIDTQKTLNQNSITNAESQVNTAQNNLSLAEQELILKKLGSTEEQIKIQEAALKQAEASLSSARAQVRSAQASLAAASAQLSKSVIASTVNGVVTKVEVKVGEMASAFGPAISVMTEARFGVEANIPEADIAKIGLGNPSEITLDAYGQDVKFEAKVIKIDPAETVVDGVSTYKTSFEFINEDEKIKSGMTANITILPGKKEGVLVIPQRYVIRKDGINNVLITEDERNTKELRVELGMTGSDGMVEVVFGVMEGERIINPSSVKK